MPAVKCNCDENTKTAGRLYRNDEWISTGHAAGLAVKIEKNAPVRLLNAVMERMDYSKLNAAYSRLGRIEYSLKILLKIMVYGYMRKQISTRALEAFCRENVHFMYLIEGQHQPLPQEYSDTKKRVRICCVSLLFCCTRVVCSALKPLS